MEANNLNRRKLISSVAAMSVTMVAFRTPSSAQDATPDHADHGSGFLSGRPAPELLIEITDDRVVMPADVTAGLNRVTVSNLSSSHFSLLMATLPAEASIEELNALMADPEAPAPEWISRQWIPGSPSGIPTGESATGYTFLHPGSYFAANLFSPAPVTPFSVSGDPWGVPAPESSLRVGMVEYGFLGVDGPVASGPQTWEVVNHGESLHETVILSTPELWTPERVLEMITSSPDGPPDDVSYRTGTGIASPGSTVWLETDMEPGAYALVCFAADDFAGPPHVFLGMISTFEVV